MYQDIAKSARNKMGPCKACPVCDGRACKNTIPGPGAKGDGLGAIRNFEGWQHYFVQMDTISDICEVDTTYNFFGQNLLAPIMVAPVGDVERHYGDLMDMPTYNQKILRAAKDAGYLAWTGDGIHKHIQQGACQEIAALSGAGVSTIKPWSGEVLEEKLACAFQAKPAAIAMDIDGAGLPFLRGLTPAAGPKTVSQLKDIADECHRHNCAFIVKGIMTEKGALKTLEAGADALVVSNHGGRVQDGCAATSDILGPIRKAVGPDAHILVDGGIRSGTDVFRALALGANAVLICRPFVVAMYGEGEAGVAKYFALLQQELADTMQMCAAKTLAEIDESFIYRF